MDYNQISQQLKSTDPILKMVLNTSQVELKSSLDVDVYRSLLESIISQQLNTKVAEIIWKRFLSLFPDGYPSPHLLIEMEIQELRSAGLSGQKSAYLKNVAEFSLENSMELEYLIEMNDEEIISYLCRIKGVGKWTAQMILMFPMDRPDVFPAGDLGIQIKMAKLYDISETKKDLIVKMEEIAELWAPYRSLACKYLWNHKLP